MTKVFISYAREDRRYCDELLTHVAVLKREGLIDIWTDADIQVGSQWKSSIWDNLESSGIIVILATPDFFSSEFAPRELERALDLQKRGKATVVAVIVRTCHWKRTELRHFQVLCADMPVYAHGPAPEDRDPAWLLVAETIDGILEQAQRAVSAPAAVLRTAAPTSQSAAFAIPAAVKPTTFQPMPGEIRIHEVDGLEYVWIPPGSFQMGSPGDQGKISSEWLGDELPAHYVAITRGFWLGKTPVTQAAYQRVLQVNPSCYQGSGRPVESVSWFEAQKFAQAVGGRLPTESEWEYAARAGSRGSRYAALEMIARPNRTTQEGTYPVGGLLPNGFGLYDMIGNVDEWTQDWYGTYGSAAVNDPKGPAYGNTKVVRGGAFYDDGIYLRAAFRSDDLPDARVPSIGFRCVLEALPGAAVR
jgi:formylglycine-generating enzyme required for sulfatase activity